VARPYNTDPSSADFLHGWRIDAIDREFRGGSAGVSDETGGGTAAPPSRLHFNAQEAGALLAPIAASLRVLERRAERYGHVATLSEADAAAIAAAHAALTTARVEVQRLARSVPAGRGGA
jgi:hypothetical protein